MVNTVTNFVKYLYNVMNMCNRKEWEDKFNQNQKELNSFFEDLHNLSEKDIFDRISSYGEYMLGQIKGFHMITFLARYFADNSNVIDAFLKRFKHRISRDDIKIYQKIKNIYFSIYKIVDIEQNNSTTVKDIIFDTNEIKIIENSASRSELIGHHILASIIEEKGQYYFTGIVFYLNEDRISEMTYAIKQEFKKLNISFQGIDMIDINKVRPLLCKHYPTFFYHAIAPLIIKPTVVGPNGDEFEPIKCKFKINNPKINKDKIANILDSLYDKKEYQIYNEKEYTWSFHMLRNSSKKYKKSELTVEDYAVYADITIENNYLNLEVFYSTAINKIIDILKKNLKDLIGMAIIENVDLENLKIEEKESKLTIEDVEPELLKQFFDKHLKATLKKKIPILNNLTPKQCLKKEPETFYKWWESFESNIKDQTFGKYDYSWFIKELGID